MSRPVEAQSLLDLARRLVTPGTIQLARRRATRPPQPAEAMALAVSALGALDRHAGVHTLNLDLDGKHLALAIIEGATFEQDAEGHTILEDHLPTVTRCTS